VDGLACATHKRVLAFQYEVCIRDGRCVSGAYRGGFPHINRQARVNIQAEHRDTICDDQ